MAIASYPILHQPDWKKKFYLKTDASNIELGATLMQELVGKKLPYKFYQHKVIGCGEELFNHRKGMSSLRLGGEKVQKLLTLK